MKKALSLLTATAMAATLLAGCGSGAASSSAAPAADSTSTDTSSTAAEPAADGAADGAAEEGKVLNIWCWNDEFQSRFNDYYPGVVSVAEDKSTTELDNGVTVK